MKTKKSKITKTSFIEELSKMTKEEMYEYIKQNGKPPKQIALFHIFNKFDTSK